MSTTYLILLPTDENGLAEMTEEQGTALRAAHGQFAQTLGERGHTMVGGAQLAPSRDARTVRPAPDGPVISEGPFAETTEQLTGYYVVESDDLDDLLDVSGILASVGHAIEVRACVGMGEGA
ncbi:YciI family protein [Oryzobacter telluris]|jgi:hypothetical protein|uniref:YciI family protein n=1 Tax=Oryzobacter telluris TaxID=3149179 RepID=UPI00370D475C